MSKFREALDNLTKAIQGLAKFGDEDIEGQDDNLLSKSSKENYDTLIKQLKKEERISVEIIAEPYVVDAHGHWYSEETVKQGYQDFDEVLKSEGIPMNLFHVKDVDDGSITLKDHYVLPCECTIGDTVVKKGTWVAEVQWDEKTWPMRSTPLENGHYEFEGLSIKGWGHIVDNPLKS
ncbi:hypothetical protein MYOV085v1_p0113 [Vibrio phage 355E48.1]|nr:hypothetical protein MYOV085v1_p0113 [Vibrio phage 355E48.1]